MNPINHDDLIKLNERLDTILSSDKALEAAANSKSSLFRAAAELTQAEHPQVDDAMRARMRAKMLAAVPQVSPVTVDKKKAILRPQFNSWAARVAAVVLILLFVGLATPPALASSLPGDALYPLKRGLENVELAFAGDYLGQVNVHLAQSQRRLDESEQLLAKSRFDETVMQDALTSLETAIGIANDHDLFSVYPELEVDAAVVISEFNQILATAEEANLVEGTDVAHLASSSSIVMEYLPSRMEDPSSSSEVTMDVPQTEEATQITEIVVTATEAVLASATVEATEVSEETIVYVNAEGNVNVREGAGTAYAIIARLSPSTAVTTVASAGDWTQVRLLDGRLGWIANFLLSETPPVPDETISETGDTTGTTTSTSGTTTTGTIGGSSSSTNSGECEHGRSCDAPGQTNGNANGGGRGN